MKLWKYIHYSEITLKNEAGRAEKEPFIWALERPDSEYDDVTTTDRLNKREFDLIGIRKSAGVKAYQETQAEMRVQRLLSGTPHSTFKALVYDPMSTVIKNIESGDWLNSYEEIENVEVNQILTAEMKISFRKKISTYLVESGNYEEFIGNSIDSSGYII